MLRFMQHVPLKFVAVSMWHRYYQFIISALVCETKFWFSIHFSMLINTRAPDIKREGHLESLIHTMFCLNSWPEKLSAIGKRGLLQYTHLFNIKKKHWKTSSKTSYSRLLCQCLYSRSNSSKK